MINGFYSFCEDNDYIQEKQEMLPESHLGKHVNMSKPQSIGSGKPIDKVTMIHTVGLKIVSYSVQQVLTAEVG